MAVDAEFVSFVETNLAYWLEVSADLTDDVLPNFTEEIENLVQAIEFGFPIFPSNTAQLITQLFPLFEQHGYWQIGLQLTQLSFTVHTPSLEVTLLNHAGVYARYLGMLDRAMYYHQHAVTLLNSVDDKQQYAKTYIHLASCYYRNHEYAQAVEAANTAIAQLCDTATDDADWAFVHDTLGLTESARGNQIAAINCFQVAIIGWKHIEKHSNHCRSLNNLGLTYSAMGQFADALRCFDKAFSIAEVCRNQLEVIRALINKGVLFYGLEAYGEAESLFRRVINLLNSYPAALRQKAVVQNNLGCILNITKRYKDAESWLERAAKIGFCSTT